VGDEQQLVPPERVQDPDHGVEHGQPRHVPGPDREQLADQDVTDVLGAVRGVVEDQDAGRRGHRVDDADDRLLRHAPVLAAREREHGGADDRETDGQRVGHGFAGLAAEQRGDRGAEYRHLGQREIDEDDLALDHVQTEVDVNPGDTQQGQERPEQERELIDHVPTSQVTGGAGLTTCRPDASRCRSR
jgi:hypothetical protein